MPPRKKKGKQDSDEEQWKARDRQFDLKNVDAKEVRPAAPPKFKAAAPSKLAFKQAFSSQDESDDSGSEESKQSEAEVESEGSDSDDSKEKFVVGKSKADGRKAAIETKRRLDESKREKGKVRQLAEVDKGSDSASDGGKGEAGAAKSKVDAKKAAIEAKRVLAESTRAAAVARQLAQDQKRQPHLAAVAAKKLAAEKDSDSHESSHVATAIEHEGSDSDRGRGKIGAYKSKVGTRQVAVEAKRRSDESKGDEGESKELDLAETNFNEGKGKVGAGKSKVDARKAAIEAKRRLDESKRGKGESKQLDLTDEGSDSDQGKGKVGAGKSKVDARQAAIEAKRRLDESKGKKGESKKLELADEGSDSDLGKGKVSAGRCKVDARQAAIEAKRRLDESKRKKGESKELELADEGFDSDQGRGKVGAGKSKVDARKAAIEAKRVSAESKRAAVLARQLAQDQKREADIAAAAAKKLAAETAVREKAELKRRNEAEARRKAEEEARAAQEASRAGQPFRCPLAFGKKKKHPTKKEEQEAAVEEAENESVKDLGTSPEAEKRVDVASELEDWDAALSESGEEKIIKADDKARGTDVAPPENKSKQTVDSQMTDTRARPSERSRKAGMATAPLAPIPDSAPLRSPILCIMGHVDTGKTKLLDKIRRTNVQDREAGGITQQIGATFFPRENLLSQCAKVDSSLELKVPGLLIIDTPGHASFNNLRKRGSSLCDIAILVIDIMHGLEPQTKESLGMLRQRKCPFVVALNKIDRLYGWVACEWTPTRQTLSAQKRHTVEEFDNRVSKVLLELTQDQGLNCELYWKNENVRKYVSVVPTSAITGEGIPDLLALIVRLTQTIMTRNIVLDCNKIECTVLEVKAIEGLGTTIDVILISGVLHENDTIVVCGMNGPIVATIRALLTPHPMKELRVKGDYIHHDKVYAAMGVKISGNGLEDAVAGTQMMIAKNPNDPNEIERLKDEVQEDMGAIFKSVDRSQDGVYVMASTLGSLEALLEFLKESEIPVSGINIGTVWKLDVKKASTMKERGREELAVILAFDVKIDPDAEKEAKYLGVKIMAADIIYHLFDGFTKHMEDFKEDQRQKKMGEVVYPCKLKIIPDCVFNKKDPLIFGVRVEEGDLRVGCPLVCFVLPDREMLRIGKVESIENNKKAVKTGTKGQEVCIKITGDSSIAYGRHFDHTSTLYSHISRDSIDVMKAYFRDDLEKHKVLVVDLKKVLSII